MVSKMKIEGRDFRLLAGPYNPFNVEECFMMKRVMEDQAAANCSAQIVAGKANERFIFRDARGWLVENEQGARRCTASK